MEKNIIEYKYWLTLGRNVRFTAALFNEIYALGLPIDSFFDLSEEKLKALALSPRCIKELLYSRSTYRPEQVIGELTKNGIEAVFIFENDYPEILKHIYDPPFILYKKGSLDLNQIAVGIVGSRKPSDYGLRTTEKISAELAALGLTIISGLAIGVDTEAHKAALAVGGKTIAVIGCGLNQIYPSSNFQLSQKIVENGAIISEYPFDTHPLRQNFPARNRIISGLSSGLIVTEATEKSGSLITAVSALNQNREVFAVPGSIFNLGSEGTNRLIRSGAHIVTSTQDILDELGISMEYKLSTEQNINGDNALEAVIIEQLFKEPKHIDEIVRITGYPQSEIGAALTIMEISSKLKHLGGGVYRLNN